MTKHFEKLPVELNDDEVRLKGEELARKRKAWEAKKLERKEVVANFKSQLDELDDAIRDLAEQVKSRREQRDVEVIERRNYQQGLVETYRADSGEVVRSRAMTAGERQVSLLGLSAGVRRGGKKTDADGQGDEADKGKPDKASRSKSTKDDTKPSSASKRSRKGAAEKGSEAPAS